MLSKVKVSKFTYVLNIIYSQISHYALSCAFYHRESVKYTAASLEMLVLSAVHTKTKSITIAPIH